MSGGFLICLARHFESSTSTSDMNTTTEKPRANRALVPTAGAALSALFSAALTRHPVSTLTPALAVGTA